MSGPFLRYRPHLDLFITEECPLRCPYCAYDAGSRWSMALDEALRVVERARELGLYKVHLFGGDPLAYPRILELLRELRKRYRDELTLGLLTRGIPVQRFREALRFVDEVLLTVESRSEKRYDVEEVLRVARGSSAWIRIGTVFTKLNAGEMRSLARWIALELGFDNYCAMYMTPAPEVLNPRTWRRSAELWIPPREWIALLRSLAGDRELVESAGDAIRVEPAFVRPEARRGCELREYLRRLVHRKGLWYPCHMHVMIGWGTPRPEGIVRDPALWTRSDGLCPGYLAIAMRLPGVRRELEPWIHLLECPMRTVRLRDLEKVLPSTCLHREDRRG